MAVELTKLLKERRASCRTILALELFVKCVMYHSSINHQAVIQGSYTPPTQEARKEKATARCQHYHRCFHAECMFS